MPASTDPLGDALALAGAAANRHKCCADVATACDACWFAMLAERVAADWLERYGPLIGDIDAAERETRRQAVGAHDGDDTLVKRR